MTAPKRDVVKKKTFTMRHLWRTTLWGVTAASALLLAVLSTRSEVGSERLAAVFSGGRGGTQMAARPFDPQAETRKLASAVQNLSAENTQLRSRLAALEHNMDDVTGSITRQIEAVKAETTPPWPANATPEPVTPAVVASIVSPAVPSPAGLAAPVPLPPAVTPAAMPTEATSSATSSNEYGVDVGSALSIEVLRARWLGIRSAHLQLFAGLTPTVTLREIPRTNRSELRLVVGPLPTSTAAAQICAALAPYRLFCQPTPFDRQHVVLQ
ncbi:MAG TPA: hypothetical protein VMF12_10385 [Xanthobacteraceae bacterium]|nr:hypothetical protein [Xanthobacteraceae bacterium]